MTEPGKILANARTIAVVGLSPRETRTSHKIAKYLQQSGYRIIPINPNEESILGEKAYPTLTAVPEDVDIDIVDIFRHPQHAADVVRDAVARRDQTGKGSVIWTQIGVSSAEAQQLASSEGLPYVRNRCTLVEHSRIR